MNQLAEKKNTDVALASMFEQDQAAGMQDMGSDDFAMPFLRVLGQLSPEINKRDSKYVEGAEAGMIFNTVTKQTYDGEKGLNLIPCGYKREYVEWSDRGEGTSAPVAIHSVESGIIKETIEYYNKITCKQIIAQTNKRQQQHDHTCNHEH